MRNDQLSIANITLVNRLVMPPMATEQAKEGRFSEELVTYYRDRAHDVGLLITEHAYVQEAGKASPGQAGLDEKADLAEWKKLTEAVHEAGHAKIFAQISHCGAQSRVKMRELRNVNTMNREEMEEIREAFVQAALRVKKVGFDGVEVHMAHGYLLNQFYSPLSNHRQDEYGGELENRLRFPREVVKAVREAVGEEFPLAVRLGACDYQEGGSTLEDGAKAAKELEKLGVDLLDISGGFNGFLVQGRKEAGWFSDAARAVKEAVTIPVLLTGGIRTAEEAETLLQDGSCDLIGVGRPFLKDPEAGAKLLEEADHDLRC